MNSTSEVPMRLLSLLSLSVMLLNSCTPVFTNPPVASRVQAQSVMRQDFFPAQEGFEWQYELTVAPVMDPDDEKQFSYTIRTDKVVQQSGQTRLELRMNDAFAGGGYVFPSLVLSPQGVQVSGSTFLGPGADYAEHISIDFLHLPLVNGSRWDDGNWLAIVKGQEQVSVPAGTFQATRIEVIGTYDQAYTAVGDYWLVPGTGIVRSRYSIPDWHVENRLLATSRQGRLSPNRLAPALKKGKPKPVVKIK